MYFAVSNSQIQAVKGSNRTEILCEPGDVDCGLAVGGELPVAMNASSKWCYANTTQPNAAGAVPWKCISSKPRPQQDSYF